MNQDSKPRQDGFNRFQTAISGIRHVHTAMDAQFDPYAEAPARPTRSLASMEAIPALAVDDSAPASRR